MTNGRPSKTHRCRRLSDDREAGCPIARPAAAIRAAGSDLVRTASLWVAEVDPPNRYALGGGHGAAAAIRGGVRDIDARGARAVPLAALERGGLQQILQLDLAAGELVLARGLSEFYWLGMDGRVLGDRRNPIDVEPQPQTYRFLSGGWVARDAYRDSEPYRIAWALPGGNGKRRRPNGRSVTSLALSPDGLWIAMSLTSSLSTGSTPDVVAAWRMARRYSGTICRNTREPASLLQTPPISALAISTARPLSRSSETDAEARRKSKQRGCGEVPAPTAHSTANTGLSQHRPDGSLVAGTPARHRPQRSPYGFSSTAMTRERIIVVRYARRAADRAEH